MHDYLTIPPCLAFRAQRNFNFCCAVREANRSRGRRCPLRSHGMRLSPPAYSLCYPVRAPRRASRAGPRRRSPPDSVNDATWRRGNLSASVLLKMQVLLDRAHASPGQIDATVDENMGKAVAAFRRMRGLGRGEQVDEEVWRALTEKDSAPVLVNYTKRTSLGRSSRQSPKITARRPA